MSGKDAISGDSIERFSRPIRVTNTQRATAVYGTMSRMMGLLD